MPDPKLAKQRIDFRPLGDLLRFDVYGLELHRPNDDPYNAVVRELQKDGSHRNVFLVDVNGNPIWRIADYEQAYAPDQFVDVERSDSADRAIGVTARGHIFEIDLSNGSLRKIGWTK